MKLNKTLLGILAATALCAVLIIIFIFAQPPASQETGGKVISDKEAPIITLEQKTGHFTLPGRPYEEEGFKAHDAVDGDITDKVERIEKDGTIIYKVTDSSGNQTEVIREIFYKDDIAPTLTLNGASEITIYKGSSYQEAGYTAIDNIDVDISSKVKVTGSVDASKIGSYTLTYEVNDGYNPSVTATRKVNVIDNSVDITNKNKVIYLTFDDGPSIHTKKLLDILDKYQVKVTFFVVGNNGSYSWIKQAAQKGHTIGLHSYSHKYDQIYTSKDAYFSDLKKIQDVVYQSTGIKSYIIRFPGGSSNTISKKYCNGIMSTIAQSATEQGFKYYDWNVSSGDATGKLTRQEIFNNVIEGVKKKNTSVVLQHDIWEESVYATEEIIKWGIANGYTFAPITMNSFDAHHTIAN